MAVGLRVVTLNCWGLPRAWVVGSRDRQYRMEKIGEAMLDERYDIAALQEVWSESDFLRLQEQLKEAYPYSYYFHSGFIGSGVCIFSRHTIVSTLMHRYSLNGFAHHIHRGDWFGGKVVGMAEIEIGDLRINFYTTHLHAEYNRKNDLYLPHRLSQAFELSQFVKHTSHGSDAVILTGDFNLEPEDLGYRLIVCNANLTDAWNAKPNNCSDNGATCDRPDNCYTPKSLKRKKLPGKRLDYIMYRSGKCEVNLLTCENRFNLIPGDRFINYSDHIGVFAEFSISLDEMESSREITLPPEHLLKEVIGQTVNGERRVACDRRLFLGVAIVFAALIISSLNISIRFVGFDTVASFIRFILTLMIGFCIWHGLIGLTMELKALKAAKASLSMLLND